MPIRCSSRSPASRPISRSLDGQHAEPSNFPDDPLPRALGWASLALGLPLTLRPAASARAVGTGSGSKQTTLAGLVGVRELVAAAGLLAKPQPLWLWARVAGDGMDLMVLARALKNHDRRGIGRTVAATAGVLVITAIDLYAATSRSSEETAMQLTATTTVSKPAQQVYEFWRQLDQLPNFMAHVDEVRWTENGRTHWRVAAPFGRTVEWDAELIEDVPGERISWRSVGDADVSNSGTVRFLAAPGDRGTEVHVTLRYDMPAGRLGQALARYFGEDPRQQLDDDLRRFKQVMETGEVVRSDGAPWGKRARREFPQRPAQPLSRDELAELNAGVLA